VHARRHEVIARAFRRRLGQDRRLDVLEAARVEVAAHRGDELVRVRIAAACRAADVEVAVAQARVLARRVVSMNGSGAAAFSTSIGRRTTSTCPVRSVVDLRAGRARTVPVMRRQNS
jgi:hypothetical protein